MTRTSLIPNSARARAAVRKLAVAAAGFGVLAVGVAMIVLPGPAVLVIPAGLAILAREFSWARKLLLWLKGLVSRLWTFVRRTRRNQLRAIAVTVATPLQGSGQS